MAYGQGEPVKPNNLKKYKPLALFFFKTLALLFFFFLLKVLHRQMIDPHHWLYIPQLDSMNLYLQFSNTISYPAQTLISFLGNNAIVSERVIYVPGYRGVEIQGPCMGLDVFATFIALMIAYPSNVHYSKKILYIAAGLVLIHLLNVIRVAALLLRNIKWENVEVNHHDIFNFIVYSFVVTMFYAWIKYFSTKRD